MNKFISILILLSFSICLNSQIQSQIEGELIVNSKVGVGVLPITKMHVYELDPPATNGILGLFQRFGAGDVGISFSQEFVNAFGIIHPMGGGLAFYQNRYIGNDGILRMKIDNSGNVGIGSIQPVRTLHVGGRVRIDNVPNGSGSILLVDANGDIVKSTSNIRLTKPNVNIENELDKKDKQIESLSKRITQLEQIVNELVRTLK